MTENEDFVTSSTKECSKNKSHFTRNSLAKIIAASLILLPLQYKSISDDKIIGHHYNAYAAEIATADTTRKNIRYKIISTDSRCGGPSCQTTKQPTESALTSCQQSTDSDWRDEFYSDMQWFWNKSKEKLSEWSSDAQEFVDQKIFEYNLETQIEKSLSLGIADPIAKEYFARNNIKISTNADVLQLGQCRNSALVQMTYAFSGEQAKIVEQYEFSVKDGIITGIISEGPKFAFKNGYKITEDELLSIFHLKATVQERWRNLRRESEREGLRMEYRLDPDAFKAFDKFINTPYNPSIDGLVIPNDMGRAQIGLSYVFFDKYGNKINDSRNYCVEEYQNIGRSGNWIYASTISKTEWKNGILIGTEDDIFRKNDFIDGMKKKLKRMVEDW